MELIATLNFSDVEARRECPHFVVVVPASIAAWGALSIPRVVVEVIEKAEERSEGGGVFGSEWVREERHLVCCWYESWWCSKKSALRGCEW